MIIILKSYFSQELFSTQKGFLDQDPRQVKLIIIPFYIYWTIV